LHGELVELANSHASRGGCERSSILVARALHTVTSRRVFEQRFRGLSSDDCICNGIRMLLVLVTAAPRAIVERNPRPLLHDMRGLVCCEVKIRFGAERDAITDGVRAGSDRRGGRRRVAPDLCSHMADVVNTECGLDPLEMR
jgi:hypothetical protein